MSIQPIEGLEQENMELKKKVESLTKAIEKMLIANTVGELYEAGVAALGYDPNMEKRVEEII